MFGHQIFCSCLIAIVCRIVCFATVIIVNFVIHDGESNWLQGLMLLVMYILIAIAFIEHNTEDASGLHPVFCWQA